MAQEKFMRRQTPGAFALQLKHPQGLFSTSDNQPGFVRLQDFARRAGAVGFNLGGPDLQQVRLGLSG